MVGVSQLSRVHQLRVQHSAVLNPTCVQGPGHAAMYDLALMLAETRNWFEPFRRYEPFQAKFWHAASENRPISKEQYRCRHCALLLRDDLNYV